MSRFLLGVAGVGLGAYGVVLLLGAGFADAWPVLVWLGGALAVHDAVLAPLLVGLGVLAARLVGWRPGRAVLLLVLVLLGTLTLVALPVLLGYGAIPDDPGLQERSYRFGWLVVAAAVLVGSAAVGLRMWRCGPPSGR